MLLALATNQMVVLVVLVSVFALFAIVVARRATRDQGNDL